MTRTARKKLRRRIVIDVDGEKYVMTGTRATLALLLAVMQFKSDLGTSRRKAPKRTRQRKAPHD